MSDQPTTWYAVCSYNHEVTPVQVSRVTSKCVYLCREGTTPRRANKMGSWYTYKPTLQAAHDFAVLRATDATALAKWRWNDKQKDEALARERRAAALLPGEVSD